ncbi:phenol-soluble modulin export ABC transporter permease subunit PmtB [Mammaliicoccus vitulinus]|uniref:phenol-soluble modulin export ABC transporter permease subunit PmtB n=1 Tax=Mammaliicoccus vitulinus TaxID=71237 RepID=UPI003F9663E3
MKAILYRNLILLKPYLYTLLVIILMSSVLIVLPMENFFKIAILSMLVLTLHIVFLVSSYYLFIRINKNHSEYTFLSLPVKQSTVINTHYLTALILILLIQITLALLSAIALLFKGSGIELTYDVYGMFFNIASNLLTISLILPFGEYKRLLRIPLIFWMIIVGAIIPNLVQYIDYVLSWFSIHTTVFAKHDMAIYLSFSIILFIVAYVIAIRKAQKNTITI